MHNRGRISRGGVALWFGPAWGVAFLGLALVGPLGAEEARVPPVRKPTASAPVPEPAGAAAKGAGKAPAKAGASAAGQGPAAAASPPGRAASAEAEPAREAVAPPDIMQRLRDRLARRMAGAASAAEAPPAAASPAAPQRPPGAEGAAAAAPTKGKADGGSGIRVLSRAANGDIVLRSVASAPAQSRKGSQPKASKAAAGAAGPAALAPAAAWAYEGEAGPAAWSGLKAEYGLCAKGKRQSPIALQDGIAVDLEPIVFHYQSSAFSVIDTGHTVEVRLPPGSAIEVRGRRYALKQFHFHRPSEEHINGRGYEMSIHLVHADEQGRLAVVALVVSPGQAQGVIQSVWNNLPLERSEEWPARGEINPAELLPAERGYYTYMGSLSTPPCSEGVMWLVLQQAVELSAEQIAIFSRLYPMNARPLQPAHGRLVKQSR
jgi:carbonic anhydrase